LRHNSFHLVQRAWAAYQAKRYDLAEQEARGALALEPNDPEALSILSLCAMQRNDRHSAVQLAEQAISGAADEALYHYRLALIQCDFGDLKAAESPLRITLELDPTFAPAYSLYAWIYLERGHFDIALSGIDEALRFDPFERYAWHLRIDVLKAKGDKEGARKAAYDALRVFPESDHAHAMAGLLTLKGHDREAAVTHLGEAVRLEPNVDWVRQTYTQAIEERNRFARTFVRVSTKLRVALRENPVLIAAPWIVYLVVRQRHGPAYNWSFSSVLLGVALHLLLLISWWGPFVSFLLTKGENARRVIAAELSFRDRSRWCRPWHICISLGIVLTVLSLIVPGNLWAPQAMSMVCIAIALRICELPESRAGKVLAVIYVVVVTVNAIVWSLSPEALLVGENARSSILNLAFAGTMIVSALIAGNVWAETNGRTRSGI
jgi:tetratricopeptide (TPR) repeat protein